jgi:hypothetical protein
VGDGRTDQPTQSLIEVLFAPKNEALRDPHGPLQAPTDPHMVKIGMVEGLRVVGIKRVVGLRGGGMG